MPDTSTTLFFATLGALMVGARYYFRSTDTNTAPSTASSNGAAPRRSVTDDMVNVVSVIVPTASNNEIRADLEITQSIEQTTNRLLKIHQSKSKGNTLFDRYNVDVEAAQENEEKEDEDEDPNWVEIREKREEKLRKQREQMLLKARQRVIEISEQK